MIKDQEQPERRGPIVTRRRFLAFSGTAVAGALLSACSAQSALPTPGASSAPGVPTTVATSAATTAATAPGVATTAGTAAPANSATARVGSASPTTAGNAGAAKQESPLFAEAVKAGKLPALAERVPKNPLVVNPVEKVGKYGGTWRAALLGGADTLWLARTIGYEHLVRWDPEWKQILPNVAESLEVTPDAKTYTFKLREGLRWSDGQPFTADDILFWYEDILLNKELTPGGLPLWMKTGGKNGVVERIDQYTVRFKFEDSHGLFLSNLAGPNGPGSTQSPKHYLRQFHNKYNPDGVAKLVQENNAENWVKLFQIKGGVIPGTPYDAVWQNKDLPRLHGWILTQPYGAVTQVVAERNPFYFKIDPEGKQLPYLDKVTYSVAQDAQTLVLKAANGEIDMQDRSINADSNKAVYTDNQKKGNFRFFETVPAIMNTNTIALNMTHKDPVKRQIFSNKDFRIGLSYAINRQEIIDVIFVSQGEPWQSAPRRESEFFDERMAKQYTEFDTKRANEALDKAFAQKNAQGQRLGPDGKPITIIIEVSTSLPVQVDTMDLVSKYWKAVGIDAQVKAEDRALFETRRQANEHDAVVWQGAGGIDVVLNPPYYFPWSGRSDYAQPWYVWYAKPGNPQTAPEEPPAAVKQQMALYDQLVTTADQAKQGALMRQILATAADQFYTIGISLPPNGYGIVRNNFRNVPKLIPDANTYPNPAPTNPCQYYIE